MADWCGSSSQTQRHIFRGIFSYAQWMSNKGICIRKELFFLQILSKNLLIAMADARTPY